MSIKDLPGMQGRLGKPRPIERRVDPLPLRGKSPVRVTVVKHQNLVHEMRKEIPARTMSENF